MKRVSIETVFEVYDTLEELPEDIQVLMHHAIAAREKAYAPYSKFKVGAAIRLDNDKIITGSNQENASYPSGLCAERTAVYYAHAKFPDAKMLVMALTAASQNHTTNSPIPPCGACRQAIAEYETHQKQPIAIYFMGETGSIMKSKSVANLLPLVFEKSVL